MFFKPTDRAILYGYNGSLGYITDRAREVLGQIEKLRIDINVLRGELHANHELQRTYIAKLETIIRERQFTTYEAETKPKKRKARKS